VAVSRADPTKNSVAAVTVPIPTPTISISVTPGGASLAACQAVTLSAIVSGTTNQIVNWSVAEGAAGGSITSQGVYTAPAAAGTYHVIAQSQADASKAQMVALVVHESILGVSVTPASVTLQPGQTVQFEATVTTTCGAYSTSSTVTPG
jgi:plastocyanin